MAALAYHSLTEPQLRREQVGPIRPSLAARLRDTLALWQRRSKERRELARLGDRELRDMRLSSADVWRESNEWFWRPGGLR